MGNYYESFDPPFFLWYRSKDNSMERNRLSYERPDHEIVLDIAKHFSTLHNIDASEVKVSCDHNVVTLAGTCLDKRVGRYLRSIADNTLGVRYVLNKLAYSSDRVVQ